MWSEIIRYLPEFKSAVLTGLDEAGYPFSVRCQPHADLSRYVLRAQVPEGCGIQPGPASLLCHKHDERLWNLRSFVLRGTLERDEQGWLLRPRQFIPGMGIGGLMGYVRYIRKCRRTARQYLEQRGLSRLPSRGIN